MASTADQVPVSAIVVSYETRSLTLDAVSSLERNLSSGSEIWVVDNASSDGSADAVKADFPETNVISLPENVGFGRANNAAMERARGEFFLLLNSDAQLPSPDGVERMIAAMRTDPRIAIVGPKLENESGELERSARSFPSIAKEAVRRFGLYLLIPRKRVGQWLLGDFWAPERARTVDWVTGAAMLVRREAFEQVGGFDPGIFMYGEEQEWCLRIKQAGWQVLYDPQAVVVHRRAASGPPGKWRVRAALKADLDLVRSRDGGAAALSFWAVRLGGLLVEAIAFTIRAVVCPGDYPRTRARNAWQALSVQANPALLRNRPLA